MAKREERNVMVLWNSNGNFLSYLKVTLTTSSIALSRLKDFLLSVSRSGA